MLEMIRFFAYPLALLWVAFFGIMHSLATREIAKSHFAQTEAGKKGYWFVRLLIRKGKVCHPCYVFKSLRLLIVTVILDLSALWISLCLIPRSTVFIVASLCVASFGALFFTNALIADLDVLADFGYEVAKTDRRVMAIILFSILAMSLVAPVIRDLTLAETLMVSGGVSAFFLPQFFRSCNQVTRYRRGEILQKNVSLPRA